MASSSSVILDLHPSLFLILQAAVPASILFLATVLPPLATQLIPERLQALVREPSDGEVASAAPPASKDANEPTRRSWRVWTLVALAGVETVAWMIQHTIQEEFADSLVITIAHRLSTVVDYDKVLVFDHGSLVDFDTPRNLLLREGGAFRRMCEGAADWDELKKKAGL